jgi:hypothetical protein
LHLNYKGFNSLGSGAVHSILKVKMPKIEELYLRKCPNNQDDNSLGFEESLKVVMLSDCPLDYLHLGNIKTTQLKIKLM